jgi:hypothetical protein
MSKKLTPEEMRIVAEARGAAERLADHIEGFGLPPAIFGSFREKLMGDISFYAHATDEEILARVKRNIAAQRQKAN